MKEIPSPLSQTVAEETCLLFVCFSPGTLVSGMGFTKTCKALNPFTLKSGYRPLCEEILHPEPLTQKYSSSIS